MVRQNRFILFRLVLKQNVASWNADPPKSRRRRERARLRRLGESGAATFS